MLIDVIKDGKMDNNTEFKALNLNLSQQQTFIHYFNNLPQKPSSTVRFFNRTDFYTVHGEDATLAANLFSINITYMGDQPKLSYVCLSKGRFEIFVRELLLVRQYRVEVYIKSPRVQNDWILEYKGSPGNLGQFEDILFDNVNTNFTNSVMAIKIFQNKSFAICNVNMTEVKFELCEVTDDSSSELEAIVAQIGPKECIIPSGETPDLVSLNRILERNGILVAKVKKSDFTLDENYQDLNRLLYFTEDQQRNAAAYTETKMTEAMSCLQAVIKFLNLAGDSRNFNQFKLTGFDIHRFVKLGSSVMYALNIFPNTQSQITDDLSNQNSSKSSSLKGLLNNCVTPQGHRLLDQWLKQPLKDRNLINDRLDVVEMFVKNAECRSLLAKDKLPRIADLIPLSKKITSKKVSLEDCYKIYITNSALPSIVHILRSNETKCVRDMLINPLSEIISDVENYQNMIEQTLDLELVERGEYLVKSSFDEELVNLRQQRDKLEEKMQRLLLKVADDLGLEGKEVKLESNDMYGFHFRVTLKTEKTLRNSDDYEILDTIKNGVKFTNRKLSDFSKEYTNISKEFKERQKNVESEIFEVALGYIETFRTLNNLIATIDVLLSFATAAVSARIPYVRPRLHDQGAGILKLKKARHPCLEAQDNMSFIPNDVTFNSKRKILHIITGPNMCGKSTYIRSIGICVLMAHIGSFVPCEQADISMIDALLVRVGADDCQLKGLSTFMLEMVETAAIIKNATANSLVIIDELGRGTSTYDGCGIAWSIVEHLVNEIKCFSLFATHYHEIMSLADQYDNISNLHVTAVATDDMFVPLYQIQEGECDKSYGVHCAKLVGFPDDVIKEAKEYQDKLEHSNGMKLMSGIDPSKKRKIISEGDKLIEETMGKIKKLNVDEMSDEDLIKAISEMKSQLVSENNLFVKGLVSV